jgi:ABC-type multidrug transport system ATPase subunit
MNEATIEVSGLRKRFGSTLALDGMTFTVSPGQVTGFVGPNGAGKSTTMRVILGLDAPDAGHALIGGRPYRGLRRPLLDEPFNGMDPEGIVWMRGFLASLADEGRAVLVSSHLMSELQETASHLVIVGRGTVIADTSVADLIASTSADRVTVRTSARWDAITVLSNAGATVADTGGGILTVSGVSAERITALLGADKVPFSEVSAHRATLEEAYMELTRDAVEYRAEPAGEATR